MNPTREIRYALKADACAISELIYATSQLCCFTPEHPCPDWYEASIQPAQIRKLIGSAPMACLVAASDKTLVGVLAISDSSHVKYFFFASGFSKAGRWQATVAIHFRRWSFEKHSHGSLVIVRSCSVCTFGVQGHGAPPSIERHALPNHGGEPEK